jgi:hypothetical protein
MVAKKNKYFILLSNAGRSPHTIVNQVLAPDIAMRLLEDLGEPLQPWHRVLSERTQPDETALGDIDADQMDRERSTIPLGMIRNVMLVRMKMGHYERIAVGQIVGRAWDKARPQKRVVILR